MSRLVWDDIGEKVYETGLDQGVLYLPSGVGVPWNGLTELIEQFNKSVVPIYYDGMKVNDFVVLGDFSASMKAVTYPEEFVEIEGLAPIKDGVFYADQYPQTFGLCYRTKIGNDIESDTLGYKLHIIYNVTAIPKDKPFTSMGASPSIIEFEWQITAIPEEVPGFLPTAHIVLDSTKIDPWLLEEIEDILYGSTSAEAALVPMSDLVEHISGWFRVQIIDNGDRTWTAISIRDGFIFEDLDRLFTIINVNAVYLNDTTYLLSDT